MSGGILPPGVTPLLLAPALLVTVVTFWLLPGRARHGFLAAASFAALLALEPAGTLVLLGIAAVFYVAAPRASGRPGLLLVLILGVLGQLAAFKYVPPLLSGAVTSPGAADLAIPLGISYYTFKLVHYAVEVSRGAIRDRSIARFLCYVFLFPTFTAGPIERFDHFLGNQDERWRLSSTVEGITRIVHGLIKKLVLVAWLSDTWELFGGSGYLAANLGDVSILRAWASCVLFYAYVYLDFSAYSDLAIGASRLFGIRILENFRWPILAANLGEFWKRWHMTLAGWCQSYVYLPIIGATRNPWLAVVATFLAIGLWHAGSFGFVLWGLYHAAGVIVFQTWRRHRRRRGWKWSDRLPARILGTGLTGLFVTASFALTMNHDDVGAGLRLLLKLIGIDVR